MELRHLRYFLAVAEELHFGRAAARLFIDQSPLSRTIKELEEQLGTPLFVRTTRSTRLTRAGQSFLNHVPRVFHALEYACTSVHSAAAGCHSELRVALSDAICATRFTSVMRSFREQEPKVSIHFHEVPLSQQIKGLYDDLYDVGFAQSAEVGDGVLASVAWRDPLHVVMPVHHSLAKHTQVPLEELLSCPLVLGDAHTYEGYNRQIEKVLGAVDIKPRVIERLRSFDLMLTLVSTGFALMLAGKSQILSSLRSDIVMRPLAGSPPTLSTYLLRPNAKPSPELQRFIAHVTALEANCNGAVRGIS